ncbi:unnamed protein product [Arctia plantaginis]|uniref:Uncharacterized protein n=1 Tax=Arctia plantaginis TaxID=874455 RepID=A0A8S1AMZ2_ARCPL|nr:unnamed protein product [Arctia plantaginis]
MPEQLKNARAACKATVTRIQNYIMEPTNLTFATVDILEARKDKLVSALKSYEGIQIDILSLDGEDAEDVGEFEEKFFNTIARINETIRMLTKNVTPQTSCMSASKLPNVDIPTFDGKDFTKFKPFYELFMAVIDNNKTLTDVQKLFYLRTYLEEEALSVIINLPLVSTSYKEALQLLKKRYDNKTRLICNHINLLDIPPITKGTTTSIRTFVSQTKQQLYALKNLDEPVDNWDRLLLCVLSKKLDLFTHRAFHLDRNPELLPTMVEFLAFLEKRAMALEDTIPVKGQPCEYKPKPAVQVSNISAHSNAPIVTKLNMQFLIAPNLKWSL